MDLAAKDGNSLTGMLIPSRTRDNEVTIVQIVGRCLEAVELLACRLTLEVGAPCCYNCAKQRAKSWAAQLRSRLEVSPIVDLSTFV